MTIVEESTLDESVLWSVEVPRSYYGALGLDGRGRWVAVPVTSELAEMTSIGCLGQLVNQFDEGESGTRNADLVPVLVKDATPPYMTVHVRLNKDVNTSGRKFVEILTDYGEQYREDLWQRARNRKAEDEARRSRPNPIVETGGKKRRKCSHCEEVYECRLFNKHKGGVCMLAGATE
jgi:hypothetical protein